MSDRQVSAEDLDAKIGEWQDEVLECRTYGHIWQPARATFNDRQRFYYVVQLCPRCTAERHMELSDRGAVYAAWIRYPDGYLTKGMGRIMGEQRDQLRLAAVLRTFPLEKIRGKKRDERPHSRVTRQALGWDD